MMKKNKSVGVLFNCCTWHINDIANTLRNIEGVEFRLYASNCNREDLPTSNMFTDTFVVPMVSDDNYVEDVIKICKDNKIQIVVPMSSIELGVMARNKTAFTDNGISVLVCTSDVIDILNDKERIYQRYSEFMPRQTVVNKHNYNTQTFNVISGKMCCKVNGRSGGKGFAVIDDDKAVDFNYFHAYGQKHYITVSQFEKLVDRADENIILQEYIEGCDYTLSLLCENGKIKYCVGYYGYELEFGAIMYGEIAHNDEAFKIAEYIVKDLNINGIVSFDFIVKENDVYLLECNPRVNASLAFANEAGVNLLLEECCKSIGIDNSQSSNAVIKYGLKMKKHFGSEYYL